VKRYRRTIPLQTTGRATNTPDTPRTPAEEIEELTRPAPTRTPRIQLMNELRSRPTMERTRRVIRAMENAARPSDEAPRVVEGTNLDWLRIVEAGKIIKGKESRALRTPHPSVDEVKVLKAELEYLRLHRTIRDVSSIRWSRTLAKNPQGGPQNRTKPRTMEGTHLIKVPIVKQKAQNVRKRIARLLRAIPQAQKRESLEVARAKYVGKGPREKTKPTPPPQAVVDGYESVYNKVPMTSSSEALQSMIKKGASALRLPTMVEQWKPEERNIRAWLLRSKSRKSGPGPSGMTYQHLYQIADGLVGVTELTAMVQRWVQAISDATDEVTGDVSQLPEEVIPKGLSHARVTLIPKTDVTSEVTSDWRPISLMEVLTKGIFELARRRIDEHISTRVRPNAIGQTAAYCDRTDRGILRCGLCFPLIGERRVDRSRPHPTEASARGETRRKREYYRNVHRHSERVWEYPHRKRLPCDPRLRD
jgi:hypothetical protein